VLKKGFGDQAVFLNLAPENKVVFYRLPIKNKAVFQENTLEPRQYSKRTPQRPGNILQIAPEK